MDSEKTYDPRRYRLFELLRQENMALNTVDRLGSRPSAAYSQGSDQIKALASKSWRAPPSFARDPVRGLVSAAKPRSYDEFFRAVRAGSGRLHVRHL